MVPRTAALTVQQPERGNVLIGCDLMGICDRVSVSVFKLDRPVVNIEDFSAAERYFYRNVAKPDYTVEDFPFHLL
jgi:hypothetical protein